MFKLNQTHLKGSFIDLQEDGEGRELYTSEVNIELVSHYLAVSEATPLVEAAQTGQDLDIRSEYGLVIIVHKSINDHKWAIIHKSNLPLPALSIKFEAQPRPNYGDMVWHIVKSENHEVRSNLYQ